MGEAQQGEIKKDFGAGEGDIQLMFPCPSLDPTSLQAGPTRGPCPGHLPSRPLPPICVQSKRRGHIFCVFFLRY